MPIDTSAVKAPPRRTSQGSKPAAAIQPVTTQSPYEKRLDGLLGLGQLASAGLLMANQYADAAAIGQHFHPIAVELAKIADSNEAIAKPIDFLIEVGPYGALVTAVLPLALQIMANHRVINANAMLGQGVVPPEVLESQMKANVARMQTEALQAQRAAMQEAQAAEAEYMNFMNQNNTHDGQTVTIGA